MSTNAQILDRQSLMSSIKKSIDLPMGPDQAQEFLVDAVKKATTLEKLKARYRNSPSGKLDKLTVKSRKMRQHTGDETPTGTKGVEGTQVDYATKKVFWDDWIKNDDIIFSQDVRQENLEQKVVELVQGQFAIDLQDLLFNGDTASLDPFLNVLDGFVKKMKTSTRKTLLGAKALELSDFTNHVQLLDEKYLNLPDTSWFMSRLTYQKLVTLVQARGTQLGDVTLTNGKLTELAGFPIEVVQGLQGKFVVLTPLSNLAPVMIRNIRYKRTAEGATAAVKDATYHIVFGEADAVVLEKEAVAWMEGDNL
jgi:HK97 family phage major capsid protein